MRTSENILILPALILTILATTAVPATARNATITVIEPSRHCAKPVWPPASFRNREQGTVVIGYRPNADGSVAESRVDTSSGFPMLDMAAREGMARCWYKAPAAGAPAQQAWRQIKYVWTLPLIASTSAEQWRLATEGAARGETKAEYDLATLYANGEERLRNPAEAMRLLKLAAAKNHLEAQAVLGRVALDERFGPADPALALEMSTKAAEQGNARAQENLGLMLGSGRVGGKDRDKAIDWLRQAFAGGQASAATVLGILLVERGNLGDLFEGVMMLRTGEAAHDMLATFRLGRCYEYGRGVEQNYKKAAALYEKAALGRNKQVFLAPANLYETGRGVAVDPEKARQLREEAAKAIAAQN